MSEFHSPRPNLYVSSDGFSVEVMGRVGMRYAEGGRTMAIDSEVLAVPRTMALISSSMRAWEPPNDGVALAPEERARIIANIRRAFDWQGADLQVM